MKNRKSLARDVFNAFAAHTGRVYDVTDADYWLSNVDTAQREEKWSEQRMCVHMFAFHSCTYDP